MTSPPIIAAGGVGVLLYGMVLLGAVTAWKNRPDPEPPPRISHDNIAFAPIGPLHPLEPQKPTVGASKSSPDMKSTPGDAKKGSKDKPEPQKDKEPKGEKKNDKKNSTKGTAVAKSNDAPPKIEVAIVTPPPPPPPPPPTLTPVSAGPKPEHWGLLSGFPGDCKFAIDGVGLTISVPGTLHVFSTELETKPPQLLTDAGGDFTATVQVVGKIMPGNVPLDLPITGAKPKDKKKIPKFPITFQGAGLIVRQDETNFIRLERTASFTIADSKRAHIVLFESYKNGRLISDVSRPVKSLDGDLTLKFERKGSDIRCSYSPDNGKNWIDVKRLQNVALPPTVKVGVSASNISAKPFNVRFENFDITAMPQ